MIARPINSKNSIDAVAFVIIFDRPFNDKEEDKLLGLKNILAKELPQFSQGMVIGTKVESEKVITQDMKKSGIIMQRIEPDGKVGWFLHISGNQIVISCNSYSNWDKIWNKVDKYLKPSLDSLEIENINVAALVLQYVDRFTQGDSDDYSLYSVFDKESQYLPQNVKNCGKLWHVHQGWFETTNSEEKILHVLNLGTNEHKGTVLTTIDYSLHLQFLNNPKPAKEFFANGKQYKKAFDSLHNKNKDMLKSLLNSQQCKAIGLV